MKMPRGGAPLCLPEQGGKLEKQIQQH